jgi:signal transduction histidine kinase
MDTITASVDATAQPSRADEFFSEQLQKIFLRTDGLFIWLMPCQWIAAIAAALWISPRTWAGAQSNIHPHLWAALLLGGIVTVVPLWFARKLPGAALTRHVIAVGQVLMSALLIHLTGGRIETHFHVFGSLAFLAFYRDWRVLLSATVVVALDHFLRGIYSPQSVFGVITASPFRWLEHAGWVVFEDVFLFISIRLGLEEMRAIAERQMQLEMTNESIERKVAERTAELTNEIAERQRAEMATDHLNKKLLDVSRQAGMAEVATSVLHNVGNVLNSANVSAFIISDRLSKSRLTHLTNVCTLLRENAANLGTFITTDPKGSKLPAFLCSLAERLGAEQAELRREAEGLSKNIAHIKDIVAVQQSYAKVSGVVESLPVTSLVEDALEMNAEAFTRHGVEVVREFAEVPPVQVDKHKVLQILINIFRNAKYAVSESSRRDKTVIVRAGLNESGCVRVAITDNGIGIAPANLSRIFAHGFTTKKEGHGFGLHSSALAATEIGGSLMAHSDGLGHGATFTLDLPIDPAFRSNSHQDSTTCQLLPA